MKVLSKAAMAVVPLALSLTAVAGPVSHADASGVDHHRTVMVTKTGDQFYSALHVGSNGELPVTVSHKHHTMTLKNCAADERSSVDYRLKVPKDAKILGWGMDHSEPSSGIWNGIFDYTNYGHGYTKHHKGWFSQTSAWLYGGPEKVTVYDAWVLYEVPKK